MTVQFPEPLVAGTVLVKEEIRSPDYTAGTSGWVIRQDGSAEFNSLDLRGTFSGQDFVANADGLFFYSATPASGNLVGSWTTTAGVDQYGNQYVDGIAVYDPGSGQFAQITQGKILIGYAGAINGDPPASLTATDLGRLRIGSGLATATAGEDDELDVTYQAGQSGQSTGSTHAPYLQVLDALGQSAADMVLSGSIIGTDLTGARRTWQALTPHAGWAVGSGASGSYQGMVVIVTPLNELWLYGAMKTTSTTPGSTVLTLPPEFCPAAPDGGAATIFGAGAITQVNSADSIKATCRLNIQSNGPVVIGGAAAFAVGDTLYFNHRIPLAH